MISLQRAGDLEGHGRAFQHAGSGDDEELSPGPGDVPEPDDRPRVEPAASRSSAFSGTEAVLPAPARR